jgi:two-component system cell cycle response regulator
MRGDPLQSFVLASGEPALLARAEPVLRAIGAQVRVALTADSALETILDETPALALVDARLPGMELGRLLAAARAETSARFPIVLLADTILEDTKDRLAEGVIDDLLSPAIEPEWLQLRLEMALRSSERDRELETLRDRTALDAERDPLTSVLNRNALMRSLFQETDRVQRMKLELCLILFDIDDFGHWNARLGAASCDELLRKVVERIGRLLRSYDLLGRVGKDEFLCGLPGCSMVNGAMLAERMRAEVFGEPFATSGRMVRLSACFGVVSSRGRSPVVVLREAEEMLRLAKADGPEIIQSAAQMAERELDHSEACLRSGTL